MGVVWTLARPLPEIERHRRHFAELQRQVAAAQSGKTARAAERGRVLRLRAQARAAAGAQRDAFEAEADALDAHLAWGDRGTVRTALLSSPWVPVSRRTELKAFPAPNPDGGQGCLACHLSITTPGHEKYPAPFRTHPRFANYVGAASPHPPSRVSCSSCHKGDEYAATFEGAGHSRGAAPPSATRTNQAWSAPAKAGAMLPVTHTEAGCTTCHLGERYQPGAPALNEALVTLERGGCYACHRLPGMGRTPKRGPDLRRVSAKLSPEWVAQWLADPRAVKPATWMPAFWSGAGVLQTPERAAIDAVVAYLFNASEPYVPRPVSARGDAARGQALVQSIGCLGCHVAGDEPRDATSLRRTFGQPLQGVATKAGQAWFTDWLAEPARYSPSTRMPNLRLDAGQVADLTAWLQAQPGGVRSLPAPPAVGDEAFRDVLRQYDASTPAATLQLEGSALRVAAGRTVIDALGCFNCHEIRGFESRSTTVAIRARQDWSEADVLALFPRSAGQGAAPATTAASAGSGAPAADGLRAHPGPDFRFGPNEVRRLALGLTAVAGRATGAHALSTPWHLTKVAGRTLLQERNCVGCHPVEGVGGDFVGLVAEPTLGPPLLTPEGSRVQASWLRGFLHEPKTIRPWLSVRMPTFGLSDDETERVGSYFRGIAPESPKPAAASAGATPEAGKALFALLKCQQCHVLGAIPKDQPTSNLAPDLRLAHERLQPDWILAWLRNPGDILPGTRMPTFWPDYPKSFYDPLDRDGAKQVRAIRDHLLTLH